MKEIEQIVKQAEIFLSGLGDLTNEATFIDGVKFGADKAYKKGLEDANTQALKKRDEQTCKWKNEEGVFETQCEQTFFFDSGNIQDNHFKYCPYCAKLIKEGE